MNILLTALQPAGGIKTFFRYVYSQPCFEGYSFTLIAPDSGLSTYIYDVLPPGRITVIPANEGKLAFIKQVRKEAENCRFSIVHSHGFSAGALTGVALIGRRIPHLMTAHDVFLEAQFEGVVGYLKRWALSMSFSSLSAIHAVTKDARENFLSFFPSVPEERVVGILHGVDTKFFNDGIPRELKGELGLDQNTPLIGFFGRFMGQKGFRTLVDSLEELRKDSALSVVPHVATFGWGGFIREDYEYLRQKGLGDYFHQMPQTDDMPAAIKGVDLVVMPSRWEACGLLAMETLAAGTPIIGTNCIGLKEVLEGSPSRQVPVGDASALAEAIIHECNNLVARREEFTDYVPVAVERFSIHRPAQSLRALYDSMLSSRSQSHVS
ncbi:Glycosyltransferase involved in cell wall bisynthesis [Marinobacter gudaonensis]|uniref:Glycosyltransferase involved in cell wall bisynthesis n=1 Tax=Marinobacter gudaonensis TaxID=375760 RepID=A0A1I6GDI1_9GAMM|nr:glycosyltransferase family 4 protein [Marinobacter gudaonensis]SFR40263.1 Glycosyltransferase involved in cell wall bisynthesis [Marinobacter gudaonensis]